ncbi:MAG: acetyl-CoA carboxylase biotin carboxyl carrier protein [Bacteroidia bacterium]|nr:acetyl-CoA carboxylase biotin carboxyl carrier protein [Bacteroidia bacterium]
MDYKEIQDLLKLVSRTDLTEVEIEKKDFRLKIRRKSPENNIIYTPSMAPQPPASHAPLLMPQPALPQPEARVEVRTEKPEAALANTVEFRSPMIGTFYRSSGPDAAPFVKVGDTVEKGQVLCIIEAMKLFNEIESEVAGKIVKIMVENAQPVEYDQVLFLIEPA